MEKFQAGVQYGDWKGTAAADDHHVTSITRYMEAHGLVGADQLVVGVKMYSGEIHTGLQNQPIHVTAYILPASGYDQAHETMQRNGPLRVKVVRFDLDLQQFFGLFKRFAIAISKFGEMAGRDLEEEV